MRYSPLAVLLAAVALLILAVFGRSATLEGRLLRADPAAIPADGALMQFAVGRGELLFEARCAACHGGHGEADPGRGIPALNDGDWLYGVGSVSDIEQIVKYGIRSYHPKGWNLALMPAYGTPEPSPRDSKIRPLRPGEIRDLAEFLLHAQGRPADAGAAARGATLFAGTAGCYDCHAADARGDSAIGAPDLTDGITLYGDGSRESLARSITQGRHGVCPAWVTRMSPAAIREAALFVYALSHPPDTAAAAR